MVRTKTELIKEELNPISIDHYNAKIDQAVVDSKNGKMTKTADLKK